MRPFYRLIQAVYYTHFILFSLREAKYEMVKNRNKNSV